MTVNPSRAERRRAEKAARKRQRWNDGILKFTRIAAGALESYVIQVSDYPLLLGAAARGEPTAIALARSVSMWATEAAAPGAGFLCLDCDQVFGPGIAAPVAFAITMPFANRDAAIVTGICKCCAERGEDLQLMTLRRLRGIWPDAHTTQGGRA
jgi:hypothetical protein